jgi:hypothetical protein
LVFFTIDDVGLFLRFVIAATGFVFQINRSKPSSEYLPTLSVPPSSIFLYANRPRHPFSRFLFSNRHAQAGPFVVNAADAKID